MGLLRIAAAATAALLLGVLAATPAFAGGWANTLLDPLPARVEAGPTYTVGYWVLQHGTHPYEGDLGATAIVLVAENGETLPFAGVAMAEPAHYATAVRVPREGTWKVVARQGLFADYEIGTLTVPGALQPNPLPDDPTPAGQNYWGAIRPPDAPHAGPQPAVLQPAAATTPPPSGAPTFPAWAITGVVLVAAAGAGALYVRKRRA
ncbi:hypothetical protein [Pseudonocardia sp. TRM90224]|uniref:hypothetical protein n=1 Tax=Pseudonocardia sp. TRM90224 TaxID=2812678 RepID=UPI001E5C3277|nr:hypothetical protein [Pseudonocardia sp. TRM90224]